MSGQKELPAVDQFDIGAHELRKPFLDGYVKFDTFGSLSQKFLISPNGRAGFKTCLKLRS
jgi:hypothetical protein